MEAQMQSSMTPYYGSTNHLWQSMNGLLTTIDIHFTIATLGGMTDGNSRVPKE